MGNRQDLNDWELSGWWKNTWRSSAPGSEGPAGHPLVGPLPARVPGAVQADLLRAGILRDLNVGLASQEAEWVEHRDWIYRTRFVTPSEGARHVLHFEGLDHWGEIYLGGTLIAQFHGMFRPVEVDVTAYLAPAGQSNLLSVVFFPPPEVEAQVGWSSRIRELKSRFNYEWDWCPRIVPIGFWDAVYLQSYGEARIGDVRVVCGWDPRHAVGEFTLAAEVSGGQSLTVTIDDGARTVLTRTRALEPGAASCEWEERLPVMPWTVGERGTPQCYRLTLELRDASGTVSDTWARTVGFRRLSWEKNPGSPDGALPYTILLNGDPVFVKGVNWVPIRPLYGTVDAATYRPWLERFRRMGVNFIRVWGGAIVEKEAFYDECDRLGILVWQEFLQSSSGIDNLPPDDPALIRELGEVSRIAVRHRRHHPSLAAWCGGNELHNGDGVPVDVHHPNIAHLEAIVREEDPGRRFFPTSPSGPRFAANPEGIGRGIHHDVHGPWEYLGDRRHYAYFNADDALIRTEVGTAGVTRPELLADLGDGKPLWPPSAANALWRHHGAWWTPWEVVEANFGPFDGTVDALDVLAACSRYLQAESLRYMAEATRRRAPRASGVVVWMGNEPYANFSNTSLVDYDGVPKPAYHALRAAFAKDAASLRYERIAYAPGETFQAAIWTAEENRERTRARLYDMTGRVLAESGPDRLLTWPVEAVAADVFIVRLEPAGREYYFTVSDNPERASFFPLRALPAVRLGYRLTGADGAPWTLRLENPGPAAALFVEVMATGWWDVRPNLLTLLPGESATVALEPFGEGGPGVISVRALNVARFEIPWGGGGR